MLQLVAKMRNPEILAPVGNLEMCQAAVYNRADAIYVGLPGFNARGRVELLTIDSIRQIIDFCHLHGTKVFLASNILIFQRELKEIKAILEEVIPLNPDAFIVQDIGLVKLIHAICPMQVIHASTQMTITSYEAIQMTSDLAIKRYVLGRENSIDEIKKIRANTDKELEVFVHGALCVSYSGQCLTSESFGGRSANRGQCAQSCRLPYEIIVDGKRFDDGVRPYVVSPQDLCAIDDVPRLIDAGVDSFKIEGRLKSSAYVADTVRHYKAKVENTIVELNKKSINQAQEMSLVYSRGFYNGWLDGVSHQNLVDGHYSNHHGSKVGEIHQINHRGIIAKLTQPIEPGDGLLFADFSIPFNSLNREIGANLYEVSINTDKTYTLTFSRDFDHQKLKQGMLIFNNKSPKLEKDLSQSYLNREKQKRRPIRIILNAAPGSLLKLSFSTMDKINIEASVYSDFLLEDVKTGIIDQEKIQTELSSLTHTPFESFEFIFEITGNPFIPNKILKDLKKQVISKLSQNILKSYDIKSIKNVDLEFFEKSSTAISKVIDSKPKLSVLLRDSSQIKGVFGLELEYVYLDFEYGKDYLDAVRLLKENGQKVGIATTRILKPGEIGHLKVIERLKPDTILIRNLGALWYFQNKEFDLRGDFSLNITNSLTADWFLSKNISTICPSYDLNSEQLFDLIDKTDKNKLEITLHQYMPAFHMEHCVYAAFLSKGSSWRDCGKPCEKHRVELKDPKGVVHPLKPDAECRNTMFNGRAQSSVKLIPKLLSEGISSYRIEALFETAEQIKEKINIYINILNQKGYTNSDIKLLDSTEQYGITEGQLFNIKTYIDRRKSA